MDKIIDFIERHKMGIVITIVVHVALFLYFQIGTFKEAVIYEPWDFQNVNNEAPDNIEVDPEQIQTQEELNLFNSNEKVTSFVKNENDTRETSTAENQQYTSYASGGNPEQMEKDYEKHLKAEIEKNRAPDARSNSKNVTDIDDGKRDPESNKNKGGAASTKAVGGKTMVSYSLKNRHPLNHNDWNIRNPGYTCGNVNGIVKIAIVVNKGGDVVKADVIGKQGATSCMIRKAKEYALKSRFNYSATTSGEQEGTITYRFVYRE